MASERPKRQAKQRLESLEQAGVEFVPKKSALPPEIVPAPPGLFGDAPPPVAPLETRRQELAVLKQEVSGCTLCPELASTRTQTVFGVGPVGAELCFIGEAPGADEDRTGEPFVGAAGQLLNKIIVACGLTREEVFICNILRCRPPGNRPPKPTEAANCRSYLDRTLELVAPKFICCLGASAAQFLFGTTQAIGKMRGRFMDYKGMTVIATYHPSFLLRSPTQENKAAVWEDMKKLLTRMGREVPQPKKT